MNFASITIYQVISIDLLIMSSNLITIKASDVPEFLRSSWRFEKLQVDSQYLVDESILEFNNDIDKWLFAMKVLDHWKVKEYPREVFDFVVDNKNNPKLRFLTSPMDAHPWTDYTYKYLWHIRYELNALLTLNGPALIKKVCQQPDCFFNLIPYMLKLNIYLPTHSLLKNCIENKVVGFYDDLKKRFSSNPIFDGNDATNKYSAENSLNNNKLMKDAIKNKEYFPLIKQMIKNGFVIDEYNMICTCIYYTNDFEMFKYLFENYRFNNSQHNYESIQRIFRQILQADNIEMAKYIINYYDPKNYNINVNGLTNNIYRYIKSEEMLRFLIDNGMILNTYSKIIDLKDELIEYFFEEIVSSYNIKITQQKQAIENILRKMISSENSLEKFKLFVRNGFSICGLLYTNDDVRKYNKTTEEQTKHRDSLNLRMKTVPIILAIQNDKLELIPFLLEHGCQYSHESIACAFSYVNVHNKREVAIVKYLMEQGCKWTIYAISLCRQSGLIEALRLAGNLNDMVIKDDNFRYPIEIEDDN